MPGQNTTESQDSASPARAAARDTGPPDQVAGDQPTAEHGRGPETSKGAPVVKRVQDCDAHILAADSALGAVADRTAQFGGANPVEQSQVEQEAREEQVRLIDAAGKAMFHWFSELESMTLEASSAVLRDGGCTQIALTVAIRVDQLAAWSVGDFSPWFERYTGLPPTESDQPLVMQQFLTARRVSSTVTGLDGWGGRYWYWPLDFDEGIVHQYFGIRPSALAAYSRDQDELDCAASEGGDILEDVRHGEAVWVVTCEVEVGELMPLSWGQPDDDLVQNVLRITIDQASGAPLVTEYLRAWRDRDGVLQRSSARIVLTGWNETIDFPVPEPLVEDAEYAKLLERLTASAARPERLLELAERRLAGQDDIAWSMDIWPDVRGAGTQDRAKVRDTRLPDAFERTVLIPERANGGYIWNPRVRLFWSRDGFWVSESELDGEPVWTPSNPAGHGFDGTTLDELISERPPFDLALFRDLFDRYEADVRLPEPGETDYFVAIVIEDLRPADPDFDRIATLLESALAGTGRGDVAVSHIDLFAIGFELNVGHERWTLQRSGSEFQTDGGAFILFIRVSPGALTDYAHPTLPHGNHQSD